MAEKFVPAKLVMLGDTTVGKTSTVMRFVRNEWTEHRPPTIGASFLTQTVTLHDCVVKFELWDTAGQEKYRSLAPLYYRAAQAALVIYDITNRESFQNAQNWITEITQVEGSDVVIALAGNKIDLVAKREVAKEEGIELANRLGLVFMELSAKTGENVFEIFTKVAQNIPKTTVETKNLHLNFEQYQSKKGCC